MKSTVLSWHLKLATQSVCRRAAGSLFQACGPATENALDPTVDDTRGIRRNSRYPPTADELFLAAPRVAWWRRVDKRAHIRRYALPGRASKQWSIRTDPLFSRFCKLPATGSNVGYRAKFFLRGKKTAILVQKMNRIESKSNRIIKTNRPTRFTHPESL